MGDVDRIGDPRQSTQGAGHGHAVLPDGRPDARDGERARPPRHEDDRHPPRAGRRDDGPCVDAPDEEARRLHGIVGAGHDQHAHRRGQCLDRRRAADRHRRVEPARVARHGGLPGDRPGVDVPARHQVGGAHLRCPPHPGDGRDGLPPCHHGPARPRLPRPARRRPRRERWTRAGVTLPGAGAADSALARRSRRGEGGDRAAGEGRAAARPGRQRRLVVGRCGGVPGLRRGHRHPVLHDAAVARHGAGRPPAGLPERPRQGLRRGRRHPERRHAVQLRRPVPPGAALRGRPQGDPGRRQPDRARPQPARRRAHRG